MQVHELLIPCQVELPLEGRRSPESSAAVALRTRRRDRVSVDLRGLGPALRALAAGQGTTPAALLRKAIRRTLEDTAAISDESDPAIDAVPAGQVKVTLRLSPVHARVLAARARKADVAQGAYVCELLDGTPPLPVAADHGEAVLALTRSTDGLAVLTADLSQFLRILGRVQELSQYRERLLALNRDVREHLAVASSLVAQLERRRRRGP